MYFVCILKYCIKIKETLTDHDDYLFAEIIAILNVSFEA